MKTFSEKLSQAIEKLGLTQNQVAGLTGKSRASISQYITGKQVPSVKTQEAIATDIGLAADYFTGPDKELEIMPSYDLRNGFIPRMDVGEAARLLQMNAVTVRKGLQQRVFPWGYAIKTSENRWVYFINEKRFVNHEVKGK